MKTIIASAVFATTFVASTYAFADDTTSSTINSTQSTTTTAPAAAPVAPVQVTQTPTTPAATTPAATTTLTSGDPNDATLTPMPTTTSPQVARESTTLYDKHTPNKAVLFTGVGIFAGSYVTTAAITAGNPNTLDKSLYLPLVGPWLTLAQAGDYGTGKQFLIGASGVLQGVGAGMAIASLFIPEKTAAATITAGNVKMNVLPASYGAGSAGVGAIGTF